MAENLCVLRDLQFYHRTKLCAGAIDRNSESEDRGDSDRIFDVPKVKQAAASNSSSLVQQRFIPPADRLSTFDEFALAHQAYLAEHRKHGHARDQVRQPLQHGLSYSCDGTRMVSMGLESVGIGQWRGSRLMFSWFHTREAPLASSTSVNSWIGPSGLMAEMACL
jgi:hypothetical protein